jgi:hypothetical protein
VVKLTLKFATGDATAESMIRLSVNDVAFPTFSGSAAAFSDPVDERTHLIALWATQVGTLDGVDVPGSVFPTLKIPERCYGTLNTFFDPDTWSVLNCLSFSGDGYLVAEARKVIERVRRHIVDGRVPHHFDGHEPTYVAMSGASQPGPNIFYCLAVLDHVAATGDLDYLREMWDDTLVPLVSALLRTLESERDLLYSTGTLRIDVFRREGFTLDTNAMAVHMLKRMSDAAEHLGDADLHRKGVRSHSSSVPPSKNSGEATTTRRCFPAPAPTSTCSIPTTYWQSLPASQTTTARTPSSSDLMVQACTREAAAHG